MLNRHITIMTNASRKNMPPISPGEILMDKIDFSTTLNTSNVTRINGKSLDCLTYNAPSLSSYLVVTTSMTEKTAPIMIDSPISTGVSLKYGNTYISAPVDIMTGGISIFFIVKGRFAAFCLTTIAPIPMNTAMMEAVINKIFSIFIIRTPGNPQRTAAAR